MQDGVVKRLIEQRKIEAVKNKISTKAVLVAKQLGNPIIGSYTSIDSMFLYPHEDQNEINNLEDWDSYNVGSSFDALGKGIHLEIIVKNSDDVIDSVKIFYRGYEVYSENEGDLLSYNPNGEWEKHLNSFYEAALVQEELNNKIIKDKEVVKKSKKKDDFIENLKNKWGF